MIDANGPGSATRLVFIHHSCGENWLRDDHGRLGIALSASNYYVSDTSYGWGRMGDHMDIGHWWSWFRGDQSAEHLAALYAEGERHSEYTRLTAPIPGENQIVLFKSCYPNSGLGGKPGDPVPPIERNPLRGQDCGSEHHTVANAKGIYLDLLEYFRVHTDKLFVVVTAPPPRGASGRP